MPMRLVVWVCPLGSFSVKPARLTPVEAYTRRGDGPQADEEVLEAALTQLELSTLRAERVLDEALDEVRTALQAQG